MTAPRGDSDWLIPSIALTAAAGLFGVLLIPDTTGIIPAIKILPVWMTVAVMLAVFYGFFAMAASGTKDPLRFTCGFFVRERRKLALWVFCIFLAGLNMTTFMWVKPLLNYLVPFWADPMLANIDRLLFLGHDPWVLLTWLNSGATALFYHRGWFGLMIISLLVMMAQPPSPRKSALMLTYFILWSVVGPVVHSLLPAGGPIFFEQLGYGDRFAGLGAAPETQQVSTYLWAVYAERGFAPGSGISAMPSLHIATTAWMILVAAQFARRWLPVIIACAILIFLLSISLGWHYALDGVVGGAAAMLCYRLLLAYYSDRVRLHHAPAAAG